MPAKIDKERNKKISNIARNRRRREINRSVLQMRKFVKEPSKEEKKYISMITDRKIGLETE